MVHDGWYIKWDDFIYWVDLCGNVYATYALYPSAHPLTQW